MMDKRIPSPADGPVISQLKEVVSKMRKDSFPDKEVYDG